MMILDFIFWVSGHAGKLVESRERKKHPELMASNYNLPGHTLYHFWVSAHSTKTRRAIYDMGVHIPFKEILLDHQSYKELVEQGGKDQVPCLRIDQGKETKWLYESDDIIAYLKSQKTTAAS
jgi:hypothetical protein